MSYRRADSPDALPDRRSFPRPPLWLNLLLLVIAGATFFYARHQRTEIDRKEAVLFKKPTTASSAPLNGIRAQLADLDVSNAQLQKELAARLAEQQTFAKMVEAEEFYLAVDSAKKRLYLRFGKEVIRDCPVEIGEPRTITSPAGKSWTFAALKGAFNVTGKTQNYAWTIPEWLYVMNNQQRPAAPQAMANALGSWVIFLPNNYVIATPPSADSPLHGPKPGSFVIAESDMAAIWPRISTQTRVYVF
jgi:hypothetical protein